MSIKRDYLWITFYIILLVGPYLLGWLLQGVDTRFSGLLINPIDGYSYYSKMQQGMSGSWLFQLPFTAVPGEGVVLFEFYLFLGHICRLLHLPIPIGFHLARIICSVFLAYQLFVFIEKYFKFDFIQPRKALLFVIFSSGLGWIALLSGYETTDFLVPEAYPFYSSIINPHFALGMAIMLFVLNNFFSEFSVKYSFYLAFASFGLSFIMPFGSVILCIILGLSWLIIPEWRNKIGFMRVLIVGIPAILIVGWQYFASISHIQLQIWNAQNITPRPPMWDLLVSFSPMVILGFYSVKQFHKHRQQIGYKIIMVWFLSCLIMILLPFSLQRRFLFSLAIPMTLLGLYGLDDLLSKTKRSEWMTRVAFLLPLITIILLYIIMGFSLVTKNSFSFITASEAEAFAWISEVADPDFVILSDEVHAIKIPAITGKRVFYAHPFETVNAEVKKEKLDHLLICEGYTKENIQKFYADEKIDAVLLPVKIYMQADCLHGLAVENQNQEFVFFHTGK